MSPAPGMSFFLLCLLYYTNEYLKTATHTNGDDGNSWGGERQLGISDGGICHLGHPFIYYHTTV